MSSISSYLTFNGNCREAMTFYRQCLGGELSFQSIGESPQSEKIPGKMKNLIVHAMLTNGNVLLMGSDMIPETGLIRGNSVSLILNSASEKEIKNIYKKLSAGGQATHPLQKTVWGAVFGGLTDKFGNHWLFNCNKNQEPSKKSQNENEQSLI